MDDRAQIGRLDPVDAIPGASYAANAYGGLWHKLVPWMALHIFHLSGKATTYFPTGSRDTTLDYIGHLRFRQGVSAAVPAPRAPEADPTARLLHARAGIADVHRGPSALEQGGDPNAPATSACGWWTIRHRLQRGIRWGEEHRDVHKRARNQSRTSVLAYSRPDAEPVVLQGALGGGTLPVRLR